MFAQPVSYTAAFTAGLLSFFSPCILPLIPAYFSFITGFSLEELTGTLEGGIRKKVVLSTAAYILGFASVFIILGGSASYLGGLMTRYKDLIRIIGGILILGMGIHLTGIIRIRGLDLEKRLQINKKPLHLFGTFVVGMAFGAGWSPCIGPLLGSILIIAGNQDSVYQGMALLGVYSAGLAIPFMVMSVFINFILAFVRKASRTVRYVHIASGLLLIILGVLLLTDRLSILIVAG